MKSYSMDLRVRVLSDCDAGIARQQDFFLGIVLPLAILGSEPFPSAHLAPQ